MKSRRGESLDLTMVKIPLYNQNRQIGAEELLTNLHLCRLWMNCQTQIGLERWRAGTTWQVPVRDSHLPPEFIAALLQLPSHMCAYKVDSDFVVVPRNDLKPKSVIGQGFPNLLTISAWLAVGRTKLSYDGLTKRRYLPTTIEVIGLTMDKDILVKNPVHCTATMHHISFDTPSKHQIGITLHKNLG